jgi:hypothetical protein
VRATEGGTSKAKTRPVTEPEQKLYRYSLLRFSLICRWLTDRSLFLYNTYDTEDWSVKDAARRPTQEDIMQEDATKEPIDVEQGAYVTLLTVQQEVGITRGTLKKYLAYLGIEPVCFHIGTRSLYISREAMVRVKQLKRNPGLLVHLKASVGARASD